MHAMNDLYPGGFCTADMLEGQSAEELAIQAIADALTGGNPADLGLALETHGAGALSTADFHRLMRVF